jgi:hypothetical protein
VRAPRRRHLFSVRLLHGSPDASAVKCERLGSSFRSRASEADKAPAALPCAGGGGGGSPGFAVVDANREGAGAAPTRPGLTCPPPRTTVPRWPDQRPLHTLASASYRPSPPTLEPTPTPSPSTPLCQAAALLFIYIDQVVRGIFVNYVLFWTYKLRTLFLFLMLGYRCLTAANANSKFRTRARKSHCNLARIFKAPLTLLPRY